MAFIRYAAIGCSGMGRRHLHGLAQLKRSGLANIELAAVCDLNAESARSMADEAAALFGARPAVYADIGQMARENPEIVAADIATDAGSHMSVALQCFAAGLHVLCEKPLGITVSECRRIVNAARDAGRVLSVAENFRRDPINRLVKALLDDGAIGTPRLMLETSIGGRDVMVQTPWRHQKPSGMVVLDSGVHNADIIRFYMGGVASVYGESRLHEKTRRVAARAGGSASETDKWWRAPGGMPTEFEASGDDATYSQLRFASGAIGQWVNDRAGHGEHRESRVIHGSKGSIVAPGDRNGRPVTLHLDDGSVIADARILEHAPSYRLGPVAAALFGDARPWTYSFAFDEVDQRILALQLHELADCVMHGKAPEVTGEEALADVALAYAPIESGRLGRSVSLAEVIDGEAAPYQAEIDEMRRRS
ncbi:Gfo/Idh/MocA family oxidoreductase [Caballeronia sp. GAFFF2]|uniref:Gfo/Idh/MocA family protein n=1 Tax=Caballeronia sp. GAFFF2 TaxID=2921741 RepID=UPI002028F63E|nr:Gfo/Idh/MocA family oxidoreductase [Caballeronia sp. GAFFF2]